ncbi:hypothetical protein, partial [Escherichia coli]|uniref:hypothetical protein n=1 Tax=Escherichia coli TaxID=562 RepID=UPI0028DE2F92
VWDPLGVSDTRHDDMGLALFSPLELRDWPINTGVTQPHRGAAAMPGALTDGDTTLAIDCRRSSKGADNDV